MFYNSANKSWEVEFTGVRLGLSGADISNINTVGGATRYDATIDDDSITALIVNPDEERYDYITFGVVGGADTAFATGSQTPLSGVPTDLQATYSGEVYGIVKTSDSYLASGSLSLDVNFTGATVSGKIEDFVPIDGAIRHGNLSTIDLYDGRIEGSGFSGFARVANTDTTQEQFNGDFKGAFYGPKAEEVTGILELFGDNDNYVDVGFGGKR
jgi:hypothetical protein